MTSQITFNFKGSIIYCYSSKLKHSQNIYFKVKGNCYNMTPFFLYNVRNCFINFKFATKLKCYVSLKLRQYKPISKMDSCVADRLLYQPFSGSVNMQQLFVPSIPEYKCFSCRYIVSCMMFLIVMQISLTFSTDIAEHNNC